MGANTPPIKILPAGAVSPGRISQCLNEIGRGDPLIVPPRSGSMVGHFRAACIGDEVVGVGWLYKRSGRAELDIRIQPKFRRKGVGKALFTALTTGHQGVLHAGCDAAQQAAQLFLCQRGFDLVGVLFAQRWDGELDDVPNAFQSCQIELCDDQETVVSVLDDAYGSSWFTPAIGPEDLSRSDVDTWIAKRDGIPVGAAVVRTNQEAVWIAGLGTRMTARNSGVARSLLCHLMRHGCERDAGVILLSPSDDDLVLRWTRGLGFWTYRSWAQYTMNMPPITT